MANGGKSPPYIHLPSGGTRAIQCRGQELVEGHWTRRVLIDPNLTYPGDSGRKFEVTEGQDSCLRKVSLTGWPEEGLSLRNWS